MNVIYTATFGSEIGRLTLASSESGLAYLALPRANGRGLMGWCERHAGDAKIERAEEPNRPAIEQVHEFLAGDRQQFDLPLDLRATSFQLAVYREVASIAYGEIRSYGEVAESVGRPGAARAVGAANAANPIPLIVPCHRVVASDGHLQGYAAGLPLKARLLALEKAHRPGQRLLF